MGVVRGFTGRRKLGASLIETSMTLAIMGLVTAGYVAQQSETAMRDRAHVAADRLKEVRDWTQRFLDASLAQVVRAVPVGAVVSMAVMRGGLGDGSGIPSLQDMGFVPEGFRDGNSYGHVHAVLVGHSPLGNITAVVVQMGGRVLRDADVGRMMTRIGAVGGGRMTAPPRGTATDLITGTGGGWTLPIQRWQSNGVLVEPGKAVARASAAMGAAAASASRQSVPAVPPTEASPQLPSPPQFQSMELGD